MCAITTNLSYSILNPFSEARCTWDQPYIYLLKDIFNLAVEAMVNFRVLII